MTSVSLSGGLEFLRRRIQEQQDLPSPDACRQMREACGLSTSDIAVALGVTAQAVRQWERGERAPRGDTRRRYVEAVRVLRETVTRQEMAA